MPLCNDARIAYGLEPFDTWDDFEALRFGQDPEIIRSSKK
jgi:hypothetical protein